MNTLLVYPKYPETFWSFKTALKFISKKAAFPPLGLLTVASMLPKEWHKKLIDMNITTLKDKDIEWADIVMVSAMLIQLPSAREVIGRCSAFGKKVIVGGPAFTIDFEDIPGVSHYILDEAELTLPPFLEDLKKGKAKRIYTTKERPDLSLTPAPMWSLINLKDYATMAVQFSRGCPFNCDFCDIIIMNGRFPRTKKPMQLINELQNLYDAGWREGVFIVDDNFIGNKVKVKEMLHHLIKWQREHKYPFRFLTEASLNLADDAELMDLMTMANFNKVFLGIETPSINSLKECGKMQNTNRDLAESVKKIQYHGMQVMGGFIIGFDNDTEEIFDAQIKFIQQVGIVNAMVGILNAVPQTRLWNRLKAEGRILKEPTGENTDGSVNFIPKMGIEKLLDGYNRVICTIYSPKEYYKRINIFLKNYKPSVITRASWIDIKAFFKSILKIGIFSRISPYYWRLLFKTLFTNIKALPTAVELAIMGQHFRKFAKRVIK